jgi:hypothetical protein
MSVHLALKGRISCVTTRSQDICERGSMSYAPRRDSSSIATPLLAFTARSSQPPYLADGGCLALFHCFGGWAESLCSHRDGRRTDLRVSDEARIGITGVDDRAQESCSSIGVASNQEAS